jgi:hypothetical protein
MILYTIVLSAAISVAVTATVAFVRERREKNEIIKDFTKGDGNK